MAIRGPFTVIYVKTRSVHPGCKAQAMRVHFREFCVFCVRQKTVSSCDYKRIFSHRKHRTHRRQVAALLLAYISDFLSHTDLTDDYTEDSCLAGNINLTQNTQNSQKASRYALAGLHRGD